MAAKSARTLVLGLLFACWVASGNTCSFAADDPLGDKKAPANLDALQSPRSKVASKTQPGIGKTSTGGTATIGAARTAALSSSPSAVKTEAESGPAADTSPFMPEVAPGQDRLRLLESNDGTVSPYYPPGGRTASGPEDCDEDDDDEYCGGCFCGLPGRFWIRGEYLVWWTKPSRVPPLITTGSPNDRLPGALDQPGTVVLFGNERVNGHSRSGFRTVIGGWLDQCHTYAVEADFFDLGRNTARFDEASTGNPILARPFLNVTTAPNFQDRQLIAQSGIAVGDGHVRDDDYFQSTGAWVRYNVWCQEACEDDSCGAECAGGCGTCAGSAWQNGCGDRCSRVDLIGGYRYYRLNDNLKVRENLVSIQQGGQITVGTAFSVEDSFRTLNEFQGAEIGLVGLTQRGCWSVEVLAKMALGNNRQVVAINGFTDVTVPGQNTVHNTGGLLALETNIGHFVNDQFVIIPQFGAEVSYQVSCQVRTFVGYNFLYWANVVRAGDQVDLGVNTNFIPPVTSTAGPRRPAFVRHESDFWAQGINIGAEVRF